jgi:hypothetical protein
VVGEERLVRGDDVLSGRDRFIDETPRHAGPADELDHHVDRRVVEDEARVGDEHALRQAHAAVALGLDVGDAHEVDRAADLLGDRRAIALQELHDTRADRAEADQAYPQDRLHPYLPKR